MRFETSKCRVHLIGDPHFGRDFSNGRPLNRRGDRERMQRQQFLDELNTPDVDVIIMVGDLFDKPFVPLTVLSQVINDVLSVAQARDDVSFIFMAGNHDLPRQLDQTGAWDIFSLAVGWMENVVVTDQVHCHEDIVCFPWDWTMTAVEQVGSWYLGPNHVVEAVVGHYDMMSFGGDDSHLCPVKALHKAFGEDVVIYSGHYHEERDYEIDGTTVHCTGSLQPYAHGEGDMYVTFTLAELLENEDDLTNKCVRVRLAPGETLPDINCLQLTALRVTEEAEEIELEAVASTTFNVETTLANQFERHEVPEDVQNFIKERLGAVS